MRQLKVFLSISVDGYFADERGDMSWAHADDPDFKTFVAANAGSGNTLVMGRVTYDLMASYWPTDMAKRNDPAVAAAMNELPKIVFSRTIRETNWNNTRVFHRAPVAAMQALKNEEGRDMVILGSGSIARLFAEAGLVDSFQFVVVPLVLGGGRAALAGLSRRLPLTLEDSRTFKNGMVVLTYRPG